MPETILLIDDDPIVIKTLKKILEHDVEYLFEAATLADARSVLLSQEVSVAFCDLLLPDGSGLDFLRFSKKQSPPPEVIILTGGAGFDTVVEALQLGACHYLQKPITPERARDVLKFAMDRWRSVARERHPQTSLGRSLVLDDSHFELMLLMNLLSPLGYTALLADTYDKAVNFLETQKFDLIISDVVLQEKSGLDFLEVAQRICPDVPVIMVTASKGIETAISALRGGAYDYLTKPINRELFEKAVLRAREISRSRQDRDRLEREKESYRLRLEQLSGDLDRRVREGVEEVIRVEKFSAMILRSFPTSILTADTNLRITKANPAVLRYLGVAHETLEGKEVKEIFGLRPFASNMRTVIDKGVRISKRSTTMNDLSLGRITISYGCAPLMETEGGEIQGAILYFTDITGGSGAIAQGLKEEGILVESMAGSLAHEINNPLTVAIGTAELLLHDQTMTEKSQKLLDSLNKALERCTRILREKVDQSRPEIMEKRELNLHECIEKVLDFYRIKLVDSRIDVVTALDAKKPNLQTFGSELEQVLINLIKNSREAMADGGSLSVTTHDDEDTVTFAVRDTGEGMPEEDIPRLLMPHISTKGPGRGSGLGLSICQSIIKRHRGQFDVKSQVGIGTVVRIVLPRQLDPPASGTPVVLPEAYKLDCDLRVVIVDDEPGIRSCCEQILVNKGLSPRSFMGPVQAIEALRKDPADVAILDIMMPHMDGIELSHKLVEEIPGIQIVYMTGSLPVILEGRGRHDIRHALLEKPFREKELIRAVAKAARKCSTKGERDDEDKAE